MSSPSLLSALAAPWRLVLSLAVTVGALAFGAHWLIAVLAGAVLLLLTTAIWTPRAQRSAGRGLGPLVIPEPWRTDLVTVRRIRARLEVTEGAPRPLPTALTAALDSCEEIAWAGDRLDTAVLRRRRASARGDAADTSARSRDDAARSTEIARRLRDLTTRLDAIADRACADPAGHAADLDALATEATGLVRFADDSGPASSP